MGKACQNHYSPASCFTLPNTMCSTFRNYKRCIISACSAMPQLWYLLEAMSLKKKKKKKVLAEAGGGPAWIFDPRGQRAQKLPTRRLRVDKTLPALVGDRSRPQLVATPRPFDQTSSASSDSEASSVSTRRWPTEGVESSVEQSSTAST